LPNPWKNEANGHQQGYPIKIELEGKDYDRLINTAEGYKKLYKNQNIAGIEEIKI